MKTGTRAVAEERASEAAPTVNDHEEVEAFVPVSIADVNGKNLLGYASDLGPDHPGFHDEEYKRRRTEIVQLALNHELYVLQPPTRPESTRYAYLLFLILVLFRPHHLFSVLLSVSEHYDDGVYHLVSSFL